MKTIKKKKTKKLKSSSLKKSRKITKHLLEKTKIDFRADGEKFWKSPQGISIKASAAGKPDPYAIKINVFEEAAKVKNFKQLERFIEEYSPGIDAALAAHVLTKYTRDNWNVIKILNEPESHGAVLELIDEISKRERGARNVFLEYELNTRNAETIDESDGALAKFSLLTGYRIPATDKTFQEHVSMFKNHFGLKRKKKKVPHLRDVEFKNIS
jgi:hypothetical protein